MKRILVCLDTSSGASAVHAAALQVARTSHAKLRLLRVLGGVGEIDTPNHVLVASAKQDLERLSHDDPPELLAGSSAVTSETPWRAICDVAREENVDLIVIGAHTHGPVARALGTTAAKVVDHAECSVLVVRQRT